MEFLDFVKSLLEHGADFKGLSSNPIFSLTSTFYSAIRLSEPFGTVGGGRGLNWAPKARLKFGVGGHISTASSASEIRGRRSYAPHMQNAGFHVERCRGRKELVPETGFEKVDR
jgi:hypothetical protein